MSEIIRCFLAVEITEEVRAATTKLVDNLRKGVQFTKSHPSWVDIENQHFTVVFLGNQTSEQIETIQKVLATLPSEIAPFRVHVGGLGVFPNERSPRVLWLGVSGGGEQFGALYQNVIRRLAQTGFEPEKRPFHPHLTLARIKSFRGTAELMNIIHIHEHQSCGEFIARSLTLFRSQLNPKGAIYTPLAQWKFEKQL